VISAAGNQLLQLGSCSEIGGRQSGQAVSTEVANPTVVEPVTRQRLVKTTDQNDLVRVVVNCRKCYLAIAL
jgi:hypothetical protein